MCYYPEFNFQSWPILKPGGSSWRLVFGGQKSHRFGTMGSPTPSPMIRFLLLPRYFWGSASYFFPDPGLAKIIFFDLLFVSFDLHPQNPAKFLRGLIFVLKGGRNPTSSPMILVRGTSYSFPDLRGRFFRGQKMEFLSSQNWTFGLFQWSRKAVPEMQSSCFYWL